MGGSSRFSSLRTHYLGVRLNDEEVRMLEEIMEKRRLKISEAVRESIRVYYQLLQNSDTEGVITEIRIENPVITAIDYGRLEELMRKVLADTIGTTTQDSQLNEKLRKLEETNRRLQVELERYKKEHTRLQAENRTLKERIRKIQQFILGLDILSEEQRRAIAEKLYEFFYK